MLRHTVYVPAWQGFTLRDMLSPPVAAPAPFPFQEAHQTAFHTARSAIYHLFRKLAAAGRQTVLVPDYHMGNEIRAIRAAGAEIRVFHIGPDGQPDLDQVRRLCGAGVDVLFTIHYAGWPQPIRALRAVCDEHGVALVEDCALSLLSESGGAPLGSFGDYAVFCLYKTLPVLDGGLLVQNRDPFEELTALALERTGRAFEWGQAAELWVERTRGRMPALGAALSTCKRRVGALLTALRVERIPVGDIGFNPAHSRIAMSAWSRHLLARSQCIEIRCKRRSNFLLLAGELAQAGIAPWLALEEGVCPLFYPLLVKDKSAAAQALRRRGIIATELWNRGDPECAVHEGAGSRFLRRHLLELPIHQDVDETQLRYIARCVTDLNLSLDGAGSYPHGFRGAGTVRPHAAA
ncbi:MAG TPA: DegT/DnrJ/EryC1/StrS family aminotransferase [Nitrospira sp.]|nr:DegT/DnrJ/EryC1/StrS family aminotransferase [Nitrospira sp.]